MILRFKGDMKGKIPQIQYLCVVQKNLIRWKLKIDLAGPKHLTLLPLDDPPCEGGSGGLSGFTFLNFMMSAIALGANIVSNINSNQRNNNNNNNDNNDNLNNFNLASNNNAGNNQVSSCHLWLETLVALAFSKCVNRCVFLCCLLLQFPVKKCKCNLPISC